MECNSQMMRHLTNPLQPIASASRSLTGTEIQCSNTTKGSSILHGLQNFQHYCYAKKVLWFSDHKPLVVVFKNGSMGPVLIWPRMLQLYKYKNKHQLHRRQLKVIVNDRCTHYHICQISVFPLLSDFHISRSMNILKICKYWKYRDLKIVEYLKSKTMHVSTMKCMSYIRMYPCL